MKLTKDSSRIIKFLNKDTRNHIRNNHIQGKYNISKSDFNLIFNMVNSKYQALDNELDLSNINPKKTKALKTNKPTKSLKKNTQSLKSKEVRLYLNNIDTCRGGPTKKKLKNANNLIKIFKLLADKESKTLEEIFRHHNFPLNKQRILTNFFKRIVKKMNHISFEECVEWVNLNGIDLLRSLYLFHLDGKLPQSINVLLGNYPHTKGEFTSLDIQNEIQLGLPKNRKYNLSVGGITLNLLVFSENDFTPMENFFKRCFILDMVVGGTRKDINLEIWLSNKKKNLPPPRKIKYLGAKEVNSGCNTFNGYENRVSLWRKEELPKVLIHELVHSLNLEKYGNYREIQEFVYNNFDIKRNNHFNMFENYVEIIAEILNICLTMIENGKKDLKTFNRLLNLECKHCLFQVGKILNYYGYKKWEDFYRRGGFNGEDNKTNKYLQKSNIFSYFVLRSLIMFNINDFIELCKRYNTSNLFKQGFACDKLLPIMIKSLNDENYGRIINRNIELNRNGNKKDIVFNNLRMTCIEVQF